MQIFWKRGVYRHEPLNGANDYLVSSTITTVDDFTALPLCGPSKL